MQTIITASAEEREEKECTHCEAGCLSRFDQLNVAGHCVLTHSTLHPHLPQLIACLVDGHACFKVVHTTEHQVHRTTTNQVAMTRRRRRGRRRRRRRGRGYIYVLLIVYS